MRQPQGFPPLVVQLFSVELSAMRAFAQDPPGVRRDIITLILCVRVLVMVFSDAVVAILTLCFITVIVDDSLKFNPTFITFQNGHYVPPTMLHDVDMEILIPQVYARVKFRFVENLGYGQKNTVIQLFAEHRRQLVELVLGDLRDSERI
jgi:hypothetical protein